jgi:RND family efflux transporter MFP subunit
MMNRETTFHTSDTLVVTDRSRNRRRWLIVGAIIIALVVVGLAMAMGRSSTKPQDPAAIGGKGAGQVPTVTVVVPGRSQVARVITASGPLAAKRDQPIGIAGAGGRVIRVLVDAGSWVHAGQVLAVIDRSVQTEQAAQLAAAIEAAKAQAALAQAEYERAIALQARGFISKSDIDTKKATRDAANAQVRVAQAQLGATRAQIGQLNVLAPAAGLVLARNIEVGQVVSSGSPALFRLAEGGQMEMQAKLAQQDLTFLHVGAPASVTPVGSQTSIAGTIWQVAPVIDPISRLGQVRIAIPYTPAVKPGGFAEAHITAGSTSAPLLPQSAVLSDDKGNYVYIVKPNNEVERRDIKVGNVNDEGVTIAEGLTGNEAVVLSAGPFLNPGQKINPKREAAR